MKIFLVVSVLVLFLISLLGAWQNASDYSAVQKQRDEGFLMIDRVCDSGCTNYPSDWVIPGKELEAENYCFRQCQNRVEMKKEFENKIWASFEYRSDYNRVIGFTYCLLGLNCKN